LYDNAAGWYGDSTGGYIYCDFTNIYFGTSFYQFSGLTAFGASFRQEFTTYTGAYAILVPCVKYSGAAGGACGNGIDTSSTWTPSISASDRTFWANHSSDNAYVKIFLEGGVIVNHLTGDD